MKRTLLATIDFPPMTGGVANYWANLCRELPNDSLVVLASEGVNTIDFDVKQEYLIYRQKLINKNKWMWPKWWPLFLSIHRLIKSEKIGFLIVAHILPIGTIAYILKKLFNLPYGVSVHGLDLSLTQASSRKRWITRRILSSADWVMTNSEFTQTLLRKLFPDIEVKTEIVYPCPNINLEKVPQVIKENIIKNNDLSSKKVILTVGRLVERKGHDMVLKALPVVLKSVPETRYIVVGRGPDQSRLKQLAIELGIEKQVLFYEKVGDYELPAFYDLADVFAMPCREMPDGDVEGFGIVFLEAGNYKKPVIAGRSGGAVEAVEHNVNGLLVDPQNENEIAQALISLLQNKDKARTLGEKGYYRVQEQFNWAEQAKILNNLLE
ncbi:MAG: Glycosyltransferase, group 1 family protein [Parcubacteria group bacterium GW2011_GWC2_39_14]|nr:MAG: Glycosyltransferase, group 1 family protein [Parcubacteria group bacterium GW2011_GWC2_39_14]KKR53302.1 MAG: Glycosyltransferase, group 1 family protein [Parcubacteria group bacterium GW2011_GWA2_40_23]